MDELKRLLSSIDQLNEWVGRKVSLLLYVLAFLVAIEVIARYVFNRPSIWAFEAELFIFWGCLHAGWRIYTIAREPCECPYCSRLSTFEG